MKCKDRMHEIAKEEIERCGQSWEKVMEQSFSRMDKEVLEWRNCQSSSNCRCELRTPQCDAVGSTAVVAIVTPDKVIVSNCGDSRAVLCRNGVAIPLSSDHKVSLLRHERITCFLILFLVFSLGSEYRKAERKKGREDENKVIVVEIGFNLEI